MTEIGTLREVTEVTEASSLATDVAAGALLLPLMNANDFAEPGLCEVNGASYLYNEVTDDGSLVLDSSNPLSAAAVADEPVYSLSDLGTREVKRVAWVRLDDEGDPVPATIPTGKQGMFRLGDVDQQTLVEVEATRNGLVVVQRIVDEDSFDATMMYVPMAAAAKGSNQAIPHNTWTQVNGWFPTKLDQVGYDSVTSEFIIQVDGWYAVKFGATFASNTTNVRALRIFTTYLGVDIGPSRDVRVPSQGVVGMETNQDMSFLAGTRVRFEAWQNSGADLDVRGSNIFTSPPETNCSIRRVGPR